MPEYRRIIAPGGTFFFTVVTYQRAPIFANVDTRRILGTVFREIQQKYPFQMDAICLLPNHLHCIWTLPDGDANYSTRWKEIKRLFTQRYLSNGGIEKQRNVSRLRQGEAAVWQRRFWEHLIRDEEDFHQHIDYIHYNPVKHGLVQRVCDWESSSFHRYVQMGFYDRLWCAETNPEIQVFAAGDIE